MKIILIRNYLPDKQESMRRFADMLEFGYKSNNLEVLSLSPTVIFGKIPKSTLFGWGKWFGYIDKWLLFPFVLKYHTFKQEKKASTFFYHICDHSNAPYLMHLPIDNTIITCHDVLAIRGGLGYADAHCPASPFGRIFQRWILKNLSQANFLACVSHLTYFQLCELLPKINLTSKRWTVIYNAFNADFYPMDIKESKMLLEKIGISNSTPYIFHIGSKLQRKNRRLLIDMLAYLGNRFNGKLCLAGHAIENELEKYIQEKGVQNKVVSIVKPDHLTLVALYSHCEAFVFPSYSEGFGWPLIEAQACGTPVIASNIEPMPEISGGAAIHINPNDYVGFADALLSLSNNQKKDQLIQAGFENVKRFNLSKIIKQYLDLFQTKTSLADVS